ncbi:hypothetical protein [Halalkalicoccus tibetensis]|uniref:PEP-CTERM protein-sorting domain-containing protein n=1 Tax=Halalkalicoccus tibetensis TaxID=175632 RepID=A0ABD5VA29_9EURY
MNLNNKIRYVYYGGIAIGAGVVAIANSVPGNINTLIAFAFGILVFIVGNKYMIKKYGN